MKATKDEDDPTPESSADSAPVSTVRPASRAKKSLARRAAQLRRAAAIERSTRNNRQVLLTAGTIVAAALIWSHFYFKPTNPTESATLAQHASQISQVTPVTAQRAASEPSTDVVPTAPGQSEPSADVVPTAPVQSSGASLPGARPLLPPEAVSPLPGLLPGVIEPVPFAGGVEIGPVERARTLQELLLEEVEIAFGRALKAARAAAALEDRARMQALLGGGIAAEARRSDPGFDAHYLGRDTVHARVTYSQSDGSRYAGQWRDFRDHGYQPHGLGELHYGAGVYAGQFQAGRPGGVGVWERSNGRYVGEFRTGKPSGVGIETVTTKRTYLGEFRDGKPTGYGVLATPSGRRYVGHIVSGKRDGAGVEVQPDGHIERGLWVGDRLTTALSPPSADLVAELAPLAAFLPEAAN